MLLHRTVSQEQGAGASGYEEQAGCRAPGRGLAENVRLGPKPGPGPGVTVLGHTHRSKLEVASGVTVMVTPGRITAKCNAEGEEGWCEDRNY